VISFLKPVVRFWVLVMMTTVTAIMTTCISMTLLMTAALG
jgi:hypothetical protein